MRVANLRSIYLSSSELKEAIIEYIRTHYGTHMKETTKHMRHSDCNMKWTDSHEFVILINEEIESKKLENG
jgi:hypothetical protein